MIELESIDWQEHAPDLLRIRVEVFVHEQGVPEELEPDDLDPLCQHVAAHWRGPDGQLARWIGTARLTPDGHVGRMAVLAGWRRQGVGSAMIDELLGRAQRRGLVEVRLLGQLHAIPFYQRHGFQVDGPEIEEAGILHRPMVARLAIEPGGEDVESITR